MCKEQKICALLKIATLENRVVRANKLLKVLGGHLKSLNIQIHCDVMTHGHQNIDAISGIDLSHNTNLQELLVAFVHDEGRSIASAVQRLATYSVLRTSTLRTIRFEFYVMTYIRVEDALDASTFDPLDRLFRGGNFQGSLKPQHLSESFCGTIFMWQRATNLSTRSHSLTGYGGFMRGINRLLGNSTFALTFPEQMMIVSSPNSL
ncbi:hypothetical protein BC629DRAFT_221817 [Irpex lacteus]|nr:hypothetical protein BC629DRAFT_221817 [Irpex lacteus]